MSACNRGKVSWQIAECFGLSECCGISVFYILAGTEVADEDATTTPAELSEAWLEVPEVTLQAFAGLLAENNGPEWEVPLTVAETAPKGKSTGARAKGNKPCILAVHGAKHFMPLSFIFHADCSNQCHGNTRHAKLWGILGIGLAA